jgi:hypothetical protein
MKRAITTAISALLLVACSANTSRSGIVATLLLCSERGGTIGCGGGGPLPVAGTIWVYSGGQLVKTVHADRHGAFEVQLDPGPYRIGARTDWQGVGPKARFEQKRVVVPTRATVRLRMVGTYYVP